MHKHGKSPKLYYLAKRYHIANRILNTPPDKFWADWKILRPNRRVCSTLTTYQTKWLLKWEAKLKTNALLENFLWFICRRYCFLVWLWVPDAISFDTGGWVLCPGFHSYRNPEWSWSRGSRRAAALKDGIRNRESGIRKRKRNRNTESVKEGSMRSIWKKKC